MLNTCTRLWLTEFEQSTPCGLNEGFRLKFRVGSQAQHEIQEEGRRMHRTKYYEYNNEDEGNRPNTLNDGNNINFSESPCTSQKITIF